MAGELSSSLLADAAARERIRYDLDSTLFVEAGAGSGKTKALVDRVVELVASGRAELGQIAAITFTEKAAAELRDRIRRALGEAAGDVDRPAQGRLRCERAAQDVDAAALQTLHAFAQRVLLEHPLGAELPPGFEVLDEISSEVAFGERWRDFVDQLFSREELEPALVRFLALGQPIAHLRDLAAVFGDNWDRLGDLSNWPRPQIVAIDVGALFADAPALREHCLACTDPADKLLGRIQAEVLPWLAALETATLETDTLTLLRRDLPRVGNVGSKKNWDDVSAVREAVHDLDRHRSDLLNRLADATLGELAIEVARFTLDAARQRRAEGRIEFHDLLVLARVVARTDAAARASLADRYRYILLDEFQDTDPIQLELAVLLAASQAPSADWSTTEVHPGRLFLVGDPKQSIYRFRRADVQLFLAARERFAAGLTRLTVNFRSVPAVLTFVNSLFVEKLSAANGQPGYVALDAHRRPETDLAPGSVGPPVVLVGGPHDKDEKLNADALRELDAHDLVAELHDLLQRGASVRGDDGVLRPVRPSDVAILLPARTSLPALEVALNEAGIPYRAEASSLVYATQEVRDLMAILRAIADPTDELSLVTALRSPALGCGDDDLFTFRRAGGRWDLRAAPPAELLSTHPVVGALADLASWHELRWWLDPSELVARVIADRDLLALALADRRPRDLWRRLRFVADHALAFVESVGGDLRAYLRWARLQAAEGARVAEPVLPEVDDESVRVLTIHSAKGLEFPVVAVTGLSTLAANRRRGVGVLWREAGERPEIRLGKGVATADFEDLQPYEELLDEQEKARLLYVALTRAKDHLILGVHHVTQAPNRASQAQFVWETAQGFADLWRGAAAPPDPARPLPAHLPDYRSVPDREIGADPVGPLDRGDWVAERARMVAAASRPAAWSATAVAAATAHPLLAAMSPPPLVAAAIEAELTTRAEVSDGEDEAPWRRGRAATALGRAVHGVLQLVDLHRVDPGAVAALAGGDRKSVV